VRWGASATRRKLHRQSVQLKATRCQSFAKFWAGAFYRQQRDKGSSHQAAVRTLAFKWLRISYRCWQTRTPYDESTYFNALKKRGSPLLSKLVTQT
jgi:hypothetical protein